MEQLARGGARILPSVTPIPSTNHCTFVLFCVLFKYTYNIFYTLSSNLYSFVYSTTTMLSLHMCTILRTILCTCPACPVFRILSSVIPIPKRHTRRSVPTSLGRPFLAALAALCIALCIPTLESHSFIHSFIHSFTVLNSDITYSTFP